MKRPFLTSILLLCLCISWAFFLSHCSKEGKAPSPALAPDFTLKTLDGGEMTLSKLKGKVVLLDFWATWCAPCRAEIPWLVELSTKYRANGLEVLGVSMDEGRANRAKVAPFVRERSVSYTILFGDDNVAAAYDGVPLLPQTFFIGRDGKILGSVAGLKTKNDLELGILRALATPGSSDSKPGN